MTQQSPDDELEALIRQFENSDLTALHVRTDRGELYLSRDAGGAAPWDGARVASPSIDAVPSSTVPVREESRPATPDTPAEAGRIEIPPGHALVRAPYLGTFYRSPKPGEAYFVEIGATVEPGAELCLMEVMKLFTAVRAENRGIVRHAYATDGQLVQAGQPLFLLQAVA